MASTRRKSNNDILEEIAKYSKKIGRSAIIETEKHAAIRFPKVIVASRSALIDSSIKTKGDLSLERCILQNTGLRAGGNINISDSVLYFPKGDSVDFEAVLNQFNAMTQKKRFQKQSFYTPTEFKFYGPKTFEERLPELENKIFHLGELKDAHQSTILLQTEELPSGKVSMDDLGERIKGITFIRDGYPQLKDDLRTLGKLGNLSLKGSNYEEAMKYFTLALHILPPRMYIWEQAKIAFKHSEKKKYWFNELKRIAEDDADIWLKKAELARENQMDVQELESYKKMLELNKEDSQAWRGINNILSKYTARKVA